MAERKTLLIPSLLDDWFPLLQYAFTSEEWEPVLLTEDDPHLAELGLKYFHNELCYPVFLVAGQVLSALRSGRYDPARCGVLFGQAGDECRGSCGIRLLRRVLDRLGYGRVETLSLNVRGIDRGTGLPITAAMVRRCLAAAVWGDTLALLRWLEARPALKKLVIALNRWLPAVPFACYPLLLVLLNVRWFRLLSANRAAALDFMQLIARAVFVPAFVFLGGTLLRARLNFPRPYEQPGFTPLVPKETHGKSFPSRHALSAAVLAAVWCYFYPAAGACMVVVALLICALRVLAGAHYVRDVAAGALLGFALGAAGMWLL